MVRLVARRPANYCQCDRSLNPGMVWARGQWLHLGLGPEKPACGKVIRDKVRQAERSEA